MNPQNPSPQFDIRPPQASTQPPQPPAGPGATPPPPPAPPSEPAPAPERPGPTEPSGPSLFERITSHWFVSWILVPAILIFVLHYFIFSAYHVVGSSMIPTLQDSNYLIISKVNHTKALVTNQKYLPAREQIIVFHYPKQPTLDFVKRVIALPGERVVIKEGKVRVYNQEHPDGFDPDQAHQIEGDYTLAGITDETLDVTVPPDNVFVLGDNRTPNGSSDSREWGFLPSEDIVGNVVLRLFPFNEIKTF